MPRTINRAPDRIQCGFDNWSAVLTKKHVPLVPQLLAFNTKRLFTFRFCQTAPSLVRYWFFVFENIGLNVFGKTLGFVFQNEFMLSRHFVAFRIGRADR